mmetsp:Transcript_30119/g.68236  ORF Transcript_30119/g.68236 Transcript_30119/m.68236 type:complete len:690 (-) Transcript_30119:167-2236(-)
MASVCAATVAVPLGMPGAEQADVRSAPDLPVFIEEDEPGPGWRLSDGIFARAVAAAPGVTVDRPYAVHRAASDHDDRTQLQTAADTNSVVLMNIVHCMSASGHLVLHEVADTNLHGYLASVGRPGLPIQTAARFIQAVLKGVGFLHAEGIAHNNINLHSVFVEGDQCRLGGLWMATVGGRLAGSASTGRGSSRAGYEAPEGPGVPGDLFSAGVVLLMMVSGGSIVDGMWRTVPPQDQNALARAVAGLPSGCQHLCGTLTHARPEMRGEASDVSYHEFCATTVSAGDSMPQIPCERSPTGRGRAAVAESSISLVLDDAYDGPDLKMPRQTMKWDNTAEMDRRQLAESFVVKKFLGQGNFGKVVLAKASTTVGGIEKGEMYAVKILDKRKYERAGHTQYAFAERNGFLKAANHPFVTQLLAAFSTPGNQWALVMEYFPNGTLMNKLCRDGTPGLPTEECTRFAAQLLEGLHFLHCSKVIFRDMKPDNVLLSDSEHIKICDFGLAKVNVEAGEGADSFVGSHGYAAPEVMDLCDKEGEAYSNTVDWYSLGITVFVLVTGGKVSRDSRSEEVRRPPSTHEEFVEALERAEKFSVALLARSGDALLGLVKQLTDENPSQRGTYESIKKHRVFGDVVWDEVVPDMPDEDCEYVGDEAGFSFIKRPLQNSDNRVRKRDVWKKRIADTYSMLGKQRR